LLRFDNIDELKQVAFILKEKYDDFVEKEKNLQIDKTKVYVNKFNDR